ncbi:cysteine proteinase [Dichomitus squalens]|uniref:Cysteine proteinase n=2 Tax=Dichomitus squalens TaxID=114155 RepID=R7SIC6_DICSQ|nr:cysteine proteinase [Dichomitus squalens LYAD-421 SS1]EJF55904.1 cysteine proteinase [Dichomitus squalens LYAD-421 SS1]TBU38484.1 cysteine proteinase [Dichomitus squalens]
MGHTKRKNVRQAPQMRSRTTRSKGKPITTNPEVNSQMLNEQLRQLGLYAAHTIGDGNCLFRALSDQLYGSPSQHLKLRADICYWIEAHKERYAPFVEDERGLDHHLSCMRQQATYGGHLELSAFAHMTKRNVKVIQPGLVYVIEWNAGGDFGDSSVQGDDDLNLDDREKRRQRRERRRSELEQAATDDGDPSTAMGTVYVAYHDWEHFSSIRNLRGPHTGLPNVVESSASDASPPSPVNKKPVSKAKPKSAKPRVRETKKSVVATLIEVEDATPRTPSQIPLPGSASPSPPPSSAPSSQTSAFPTLASLEPHAYRSPKRTFDESSASSQMSESSQSAAKRAKSGSRATSTSRTLSAGAAAAATATKSMSVDADDLDTPDLSAVGSSADSVSSLSSVPSPAATPPPVEPPVENRLTRRQRKKLGLPKPRPANVGRTVARTRSAGKIVIPGGKLSKTSSKTDVADGSEDDPNANAEWRKNGTGRLDVRGFRELKI